MGEANHNPLSQAKRNGQQIIKVVDLGDDFVLAGISLQPVFDETKENLCVVLVAVAGLQSQIVGLQAVPTVIGEVGRISLVDLKASIRKAIQPEPSV